MKYIYLKDVDSHIFNGGEVHVKNVDKFNIDNNEVMVIVELRSSEDIMKLLLLTNALRKLDISEIHLTMSYVPYSRQDRVCCTGEAFSLEVFSEIINLQKYKTISVTDIHSKKTEELLDNCIVYTSYSKVKSIIKRCKNKKICLVYPDKGAKGKTFQYTKLLNEELDLDVKCIGFNKVRDLSTGNIIGLDFDNEISIDGDYEYIVVDDICDGGRTFIEIAKKMKLTRNNITLFTTHGIFSNGLEELQKYYKKIYTTSSFYNQKVNSVELI